MIWEGGVQPVVLLSKLDLCADPEQRIADVEAVALGVPVHALSVVSGAGLAALERYLMPGRTLALIGSSGVGKSTLANKLLGGERLATSDIRESDQRGRHTTTARELFVLESGALLIDTPGMRELGLWDAAEGFSAAFDDIEALAMRCKFGDCRHEREPGCAIQAAVAGGALDEARLSSYRKLLRELAHEARSAIRERWRRTGNTIDRCFARATARIALTPSARRERRRCVRMLRSWPWQPWSTERFTGIAGRSARRSPR